ncbi:42979_t:CDS:2 [Gigaspora margarita]|uniref:42979_t:CDS:1 n=1 Tax=Gigaspora margarita TaxID=4874 RepID=A0ABN7UE11_GIGMA|nr:42979_t:CDS:2 [Gigaspora margarita]
MTIDNSKYEASEYNQALTPTSLGLSYFYQNGIDGQSISISYQKATKISSACSLVHLQQKGIKGTTRKYKYQNSIDISYVCGINNKPRTLVANNKATVEEHNKDDNNILAFDQENVTESCDKNDGYQEFANDKKPVKIGQGNCYQDRGDIKEHKPKEFINYQKHEKISHVIECNSRIICINKAYNLGHCFENRIRNSKGNLPEQYSPGIYYQNGISTAKDEKTAYK